MLISLRACDRWQQPGSKPKQLCTLAPHLDAADLAKLAEVGLQLLLVYVARQVAHKQPVAGLALRLAALVAAALVRAIARACAGPVGIVTCTQQTRRRSG